MKAKQMRFVRNMIMIATVIGGFILWLFIPHDFKNTAFFHVGNGEYGTKAAALIFLLFPLLALIPNKDESEVHTEDPKEREKLMEEYALREAKRQVIVAIFLGVTIFAVFGVAALIL